MAPRLLMKVDLSGAFTGAGAGADTGADTGLLITGNIIL
jgi:hypothetical protein